MNTISIQKNNVSFNKDRKTFTCEISEVGNNFFPSRYKTVKLKNEKTGNFSTFNFWKIDYQGSMEDREIAGWWYKNDEYKLLIIND